MSQRVCFAQKSPKSEDIQSEELQLATRCRLAAQLVLPLQASPDVSPLHLSATQAAIWHDSRASLTLPGRNDDLWKPVKPSDAFRKSWKKEFDCGSGERAETLIRQKPRRREWKSLSARPRLWSSPPPPAACCTALSLRRVHLRDRERRDAASLDQTFFSLFDILGQLEEERLVSARCADSPAARCVNALFAVHAAGVCVRVWTQGASVQPDAAWRAVTRHTNRPKRFPLSLRRRAAGLMS